MTFGAIEMSVAQHKKIISGNVVFLNFVLSSFQLLKENIDLVG